MKILCLNLLNQNKLLKRKNNQLTLLQIKNIKENKNRSNNNN